MERLSDGEFRLMEVLWDSAPINSTQLVALCRQRLQWNKSTTYTVLRKLCGKGAAANQEATVTALVTREQVLRQRGDELVDRAGGLSPFFTAFFSGRKLSRQEAQELKRLIDERMGG